MLIIQSLLELVNCIAFEKHINDLSMTKNNKLKNRLLDRMSVLEKNTLAKLLEKTGRNFYKRGWVLGTSGNFSTVLCDEPLEIMITASGVDKGDLDVNKFLVINSEGEVISGTGSPSAETALHLKIVELKNAKAVLHTHSVWSTILSNTFRENRGIKFEGFEMLKGLSGVTTHEHEEWLPIIENSQNYSELADTLEKTLIEHPACHGVLLHQHGLYTWGNNLAEAKRHIEIFEFLFEVKGRSQQ
ncbi:MAG: methylthioribulose 1-phosphate dehydratase [Acidobacteriota bacterium]